jgi:hypothetical protein
MDYNSGKFPDNSTVGNRDREERRTPRKIKRASTSDRFRDREQHSFVNDGLQNVLTNMFWRRLIPDTKSFLLDILAEWWGVGSGRYRSSGYRDYSTRPSGPIPVDRVDRESYRPSRRIDDEWNDFVYDSKDEALDYLDQLEDCIDRNGVVSVPKFYQLIGYKGGNYAVERYGWKNLDAVKIYYDDREEGYKMRFPMPVVLDRRW